LAGLALGKGGNRAGIHNIEVRFPVNNIESSGQKTAHHLRLILVNPAAEGKQVNARTGVPRIHLGVSLHGKAVETHLLRRPDPRLHPRDLYLL